MLTTVRAGLRDFDGTERSSVRALYRDNHALQTLECVREKRREFLALDRSRVSVWAALEALDEIVDESDPDLARSQLDHAIQTAEAIRAAGEPRWLILTGFIHDLGKMLCVFGEPQWAVVGDTFPVGCRFDERIVYPELFAANPDAAHPLYSTRLGIYHEHCGLDQVLMSWGHDEYLYHVVGRHLPGPGAAIIRYHSFYAAHHERAYDYLMDAVDAERMAWLRRFSAYDLYSKSERPPDWPGLRGYYEELVAEFLPENLMW